MIAKSPDVFHAIRLSNGKDAWSAAVSRSASYLVSDRALIVFEPDSRLFIIDSETGKMKMELPVPLLAETKSLNNLPGTTVVATAVLDGNMFYVLSKELDLYAIDADAGHLQWRIPIRKTAVSLRAQGGRVYAGTDTGDLIVIDAATGTIAGATKLDTGPVHVDYAGAEFIDSKIEQEIAADRAELAELKAEYKQAVGDAKAKLKTKMDAADRRLEARLVVLTEKINAIASDGEARLNTLEQQAAKAKHEMKLKLDTRIAHERTAHKARTEKLREAWKLVKEAAAI